MYIPAAGAAALLGFIFTEGRRKLRCCRRRLRGARFRRIPPRPWTLLHQFVPVFRSQHSSRFLSAVLLLALVAALAPSGSSPARRGARLDRACRGSPCLPAYRRCRAEAHGCRDGWSRLILEINPFVSSRNPHHYKRRLGGPCHPPCSEIPACSTVGTPPSIRKARALSTSRTAAVFVEGGRAAITQEPGRGDRCHWRPPGAGRLLRIMTKAGDQCRPCDLLGNTVAARLPEALAASSATRPASLLPFAGRCTLLAAVGPGVSGESRRACCMSASATERSAESPRQRTPPPAKRRARLLLGIFRVFVGSLRTFRRRLRPLHRPLQAIPPADGRHRVRRPGEKRPGDRSSCPSGPTLSPGRRSAMR
jgi:hypothetical protein